MNFGMLFIMIITKVARGPGGGKESVLGIDICDTGAWIAYAFLVVAAVIMTGVAASVSNKEHQHKLSNGYNFTKGDQRLTLKNSMKLATIAFFGAFFAALCGIGPGLIFNSVLISFDMHPAAASATGMYLTLWTTLAASINLLINEQLNIPFSILINIMTLIGTLPGL